MMTYIANARPKSVVLRLIIPYCGPSAVEPTSKTDFPNHAVLVEQRLRHFVSIPSHGESWTDTVRLGSAMLLQ